ncbi:helix-turn-helix domain-containing protein [Streptomyces beigongshangae]|uniref:helix-turn-helix domain-containing protein n=1 Tax=Streptomyces beigongshangae TaxID=2841597 RepID=UPI001C84C564|nr:helix-turn-helix domain-containing protein [Streptomyces sp. REN17]
MTNRPPAHPSPARQLGQALRELQQRSGRTLRALEQQVAISDSSLSRYFRGDTVPPWPVVRDLCRALGADPAGYRSLWEAAERTRPHEAPSASTPDPTPASTPHPTASPRRHHMRALLVGRWAFAVAGAATGAVITLFVLLALSESPAVPPVQGSAAELQSAGTSPSNTRKPPPMARIFVSRTTGNCLDDSLDYGLRSFKCNHLPYQWWTVRSLSDDSRQLRNQATGRCLADTRTGLRIQDCTVSPAQRWTLNAGGDEAVTVKNTVTGHCLDDSDAGLRTLPCTGTRHQAWG